MASEFNISCSVALITDATILFDRDEYMFDNSFAWSPLSEPHKPCQR